MCTTGTTEETPNGQRRLRLASATNAAVPAYVELGLPLHTYHLPFTGVEMDCHLVSSFPLSRDLPCEQRFNELLIAYLETDGTREIFSNGNG